MPRGAKIFLLKLNLNAYFFSEVAHIQFGKSLKISTESFLSEIDQKELLEFISLVKFNSEVDKSFIDMIHDLRNLINMCEDIALFQRYSLKSEQRPGCNWYLTTGISLTSSRQIFGIGDIIFRNLCIEIFCVYLIYFLRFVLRKEQSRGNGQMCSDYLNHMKPFFSKYLYSKILTKILLIFQRMLSYTRILWH